MLSPSKCRKRAASASRLCSIRYVLDSIFCSIETQTSLDFQSDTEHLDSIILASINYPGSR